MANDKKINEAVLATLSHEKSNLAIINKAFDNKRIDEATRDYLRILYTDSMDLFREVFLHIGKCFGAPKAAVKPYDYTADSIVNKNITISDINPLSPYLVQHRLDIDPMRNQFFTATMGHKIDLAVSSITSVIVGAQKDVNRAINKILDKYYPDYVNEVIEDVQKITEKYYDKTMADDLVYRVRNIFDKTYISDASVAILKIIDLNNQKMVMEIIRALDKIVQPYKRLKDVWRAKCLFDLVPQARTFIDNVCDKYPDRILEVRDKFFDITNPRGYRDAKLILNIGQKDKIIPMEIICQVRTFFEFEHKTHSAYEMTRESQTGKFLDKIETNTEILHTKGVRKYNAMICKCLDDLFDRIGWNILYYAGNEDMLFEGFPKLSNIYYPQKITDSIMDKVDRAIENEVFFIQNAPVKLTKDQEIRIFKWMAKFILVAAMPYSDSNWAENTDTMAGKFFSFVMRELHRLYKK